MALLCIFRFARVLKPLGRPFIFFEPNVDSSGPPWPMLYVTSLALVP